MIILAVLAAFLGGFFIGCYAAHRRSSGVFDGILGLLAHVAEEDRNP